MKVALNKLFISFVILFLSCENQGRDILKQRIESIDSAPISEKVYVFEVDSNKKIVDTVALRTLKYDDADNLIFEKNLQMKNNLETFNYYDLKNGMIYSKVKENGKVVSDFRVNLEDELIVSANYNVYNGELKDSVFMRYHYVLHKGKKRELLIDSGDGFRTIELYNDFEKPVLNISMHNQDTLEKINFEYGSDNAMVKKSIKNFSRNEETVYNYQHGDIIKESLLRNGYVKSEMYYYKDKQGNYLSYSESIENVN